MRTTFETLYSLNSSGERFEFSLEVFENKIYIRQGYDGDLLREAPIRIYEIDCENGRNPWEQAIVEGEKIFQERIKSGYTTDPSGVPRFPAEIDIRKDL